MRHQVRPPGGSRRWACRFALLSTMLLALFAVSSCREAPPAKSENDEQSAADATAAPELCARMLDNLLDAIEPGRFGISSDRRDIVSALNSWREQCSDSDSFSLSEQDAALREQYLPDDTYERTTGERYTDRDGEYIRNVMLVQDLVNATLLDERTDRQRAVSLFYKVVQTVDLRRVGPETLSFGPYETAVFSWGTAADRAWLYGMMMRQLRLDAVVIRPRTDSAEESDAWLVGVIVPDEGVYLFDFQLGLPVVSPSNDDRLPLPRNPVTFAEARENDEVFRQYDLQGRSYPLSADQLADVEVLAIGESSTWSPRLGILQAALPTSLQLFDGLEASSLREHGVIERLIIAGQDGLWSKEAVGIWSHPEQVYRRARQRTPEQSQLLEFQAKILDAPVMVTFKQQGEQVVPEFEWSKQNLHQARIRHLRGDYQAALGVYLKTRLAPKQVGGQRIDPNYYGTDWSTYWASLAHYDQEDYTDAVESTAHYLRVPGLWTTAAKVLQAKSLALSPEPRLKKAADVLDKLPIRSPHRAGDQWLVRRWRRLAESPAEPPADGPAADKPQSAPTEEPQTAPAELPKQTPEDLPPAEKPADSRFPPAADSSDSAAGTATEDSGSSDVE